MKRRRRSHDQNIATAARNHAWQIKMRQVHDRGHVDLHHFDKPVERHLVKFAVRAETGVVHQQVDGDILLLGEMKKSAVGRDGCARSATQTSVRMSCLALSSAGEAREPVAPPRRQHQIRSARRKLPRQCRADPRARARDQRPLALPVIHPAPD